MKNRTTKNFVEEDLRKFPIKRKKERKKEKRKKKKGH